MLLGRTRVSRDESILFSACFDDEVTYILCAGRTQDPDIQWRVAFSTLSEVSFLNLFFIFYFFE